MKDTHAKKIMLLTSVSALFVMTVTHPLHANTVKVEKNTTQAAKNLNSLLVNMKSMQADFSQKTTVDNVKNNTKQRAGMSGLRTSGLNKNFSGSMKVQRPNNFYWHTKQPAEQKIISNNKDLWVYDPDLEQVTKQKVDNQFSNTPALLLSGSAKKILNNFTVLQPKNNVNTFVLIPKTENAAFERLAIAFKNKQPRAMVLNDSLGQTTTITFNKIQLNKRFNRSVFNFSVPKGVDVINQ